MNSKQLISAVGRSNDIFAKLKKKYPGLDGYLVFSSPYGQCELTTNLSDILNYFPQMMTECKQKDKGLQLVRKNNVPEEVSKRNSGNPRSAEKLKQQLDEIVENLEVDEDTFVEIRFKSVDYDTIFELQKDELVSQEHTPQTKTSIRIVLGTIKDLQ